MENKEGFEVIKFAASKVPEFTESKETTDSKYVVYGAGQHYNLIPNYLLKLYNECGVHASIIENKTNYIIGDGLQYESGSDLLFNANASDTSKELVQKAVKDYLLFNYFAIQVVYNVFGDPVEYHHVPAHKIRTNKSKTKFWFCDDWTNAKKPIVFDRWSKKSTDTTTKIFFFDGYFPSVNDVYPRPEYMAACASIETDIAIKAYNKNTVNNSFSPSNLFTFFMGQNVSDEQKKEAVRRIKDSYTGEHGEKIIIDFQNANGKAAEVKQLSSGDWADQYLAMGTKVTDDILIAHQVTSPILFGVKDAGQLGGTTEMESSFHIFKSTYVKNKRDALESAFNLLFSNFSEVKGKVKFGDTPLFPPQVSEATKEKVMTINEMRKEIGLPPIADGDRLLSQTSQPAVEPSNPEPVEQADQEDLKKSPGS